MANSCVLPESSFRYLCIRYNGNNKSKNNNPAIIIANNMTGWRNVQFYVYGERSHRNEKRLLISTEPDPYIDMDSQNKGWLTGCIDET